MKKNYYIIFIIFIFIFFISGCSTNDNGGNVETPSVNNTYKCDCGWELTNEGFVNFCPDCGSVADIPDTFKDTEIEHAPAKSDYMCDKCLWKPMNGLPVNFCPNCGDVFDKNDVITESNFLLGEIADNKFYSDFTRIGFEASNDWVFYTSAEIKELNNIDPNITDEEALKILRKSMIISDMYATNIVTEEVVNIDLERLYGSTINDNITTILEQQLKFYKHSFTELGATINKNEIIKLKVQDKEFDAIFLDLNMESVHFYEYIIGFKLEDYVVYTTICSKTTEGLYSTLNLLSIE